MSWPRPLVFRLFEPVHDLCQGFMAVLQGQIEKSDHLSDLFGLGTVGCLIHRWCLQSFVVVCPFECADRLGNLTIGTPLKALGGSPRGTRALQAFGLLGAILCTKCAPFARVIRLYRAKRWPDNVDRPEWSDFDLVAISVERRAARAKSRLVHVSLLGFNLRFMENWRSLQSAIGGVALDYETTMILMAIIVISAEKLLRTDLDPALHTIAQQLPHNRASKVNLSSIAAAIGINRETVRRKVGDLQKAGLVARDRDGIRVVHGVIGVEVVQEIIQAQLDAIARIVNHLLKLGVLLIPEGSDERRAAGVR